jgi:hypothetical protein
MLPFRMLAYAFAVVALAACGGGGSGGAVPAAAPDTSTLDPNGTSVAFEKATLWVAYDSSVNAFSADGSGNVTPLQTLGTFSWPDRTVDSPGITDIAIAPDGTKWVLENRSFALGGAGWRLFAVAPADRTPENQYGDSANRPFALGLAGDGVMVGYYDSTGSTIATYPYASNNVPPMRTFHTTDTVRAFAEGNDGRLYVAFANSVGVYRPESDGTAPLKSIPITTTAPGHVTMGPHEFAVGPENSIYIVDLPGSNANPVMYVNVYAPGTATLARRIGPLPANYNGLGFPVIAVDSANRLFIATQGQLYRFGPNANGAATPQRVMNDPTQSRARALALGPKL